MTDVLQLPRTTGAVRYGRPDGRWILLACVVGTGMIVIDGIAVDIALPHIGRALNVDASGLQWVVNAYALTLAAFVLLGGWLTDRIGRRRAFMVGVCAFAGSSLLCGLAPDITVLAAARAMQGVAAALLLPASMAILQSSFQPVDRARAIGAWTGRVGVVGAIGPFLAGWLLDVGNWRMVFLINLPLAAVVLFVAARHVPESSNSEAAHRPDLGGAALGAITLAGVTYGFTAWSGRGPADPAVLASLAVGVAGLVGFIRAQGRGPRPILPLGLFRDRAFTAINLITFAVYAALAGFFFFFAIDLQVVVGLSPLAAGMALLPITLLMVSLSPRTSALAARIGLRIPASVGPLTCALALTMLSRVGPGEPYTTGILLPVTALGLGLALTLAPLASGTLTAARDENAGVASGINNTVVRIAGLLAIAVLPLVVGVGDSITNPVTFAPAYRLAMFVCAGVMAAAALVAVTVIPRVRVD